MKNKHLFLLLSLIFVSNQAFSQTTLDKCSPDQSARFLIGTWLGEFTQYSCGINASYPMTVEIKTAKNNTFEGIFIWNDLPYSPASKSTLKGEIRGDKIYFREESLLSGEGLVMNGTYEIDLLDCRTMKGFWYLKEMSKECPDSTTLSDGGRFEIKKVVKDSQNPERSVVVKEQLQIKSDYVKIRVWDHGQQDGDIITLRLNGEIILEKYKIRKKAKELLIPLKSANNIIELYAHNLGNIPPNTAAIAVYSGGQEIKSLILKSDMHRSEAIKINKEK